MLKSVISRALFVLYVVVSVSLIVLIFTNNISPLGVAGMVIIMTLAGSGWAVLRPRRRRRHIKKGAPEEAPVSSLRWTNRLP